MAGKDEGQVSETSMMTPEGGDGAPGTEDATPGAADTQHSPHEGPKDYTKHPDEEQGSRAEA